jgi:RHS repeat-associated protein
LTQFTFDAWNRHRQTKNSSGTLLRTHSYDALGRRLIEERTATGGGVEYRTLYYSASWQVVEERVSTTPGTEGPARIQYVWSIRYVDEMVLRDRDADSNGSLEERLYVIQDANFNVTATINTSATVQERMLYDPYGSPKFFTSAYGSPTDAGTKAWTYLHQGGRFDQNSKLFHFRNREHHPYLGRWVQRDPLGYHDGLSLYLGLLGNPVSIVDPLGLMGGGRGMKHEERTLREVEKVDCSKLVNWLFERLNSLHLVVDRGTKFGADAGHIKNAQNHCKHLANDDVIQAVVDAIARCFCADRGKALIKEFGDWLEGIRSQCRNHQVLPNLKTNPIPKPSVGWAKQNPSNSAPLNAPTSLDPTYRVPSFARPSGKLGGIMPPAVTPELQKWEERLENQEQMGRAQLTAGLVLLGATIVADVVTAGASVADDPVTIPLALRMILAGLR